MWLLRKLYAGNGGVLPPTDPRILAMTEHQIELDFEHFLIDKEEKDALAKGTEQYEDDGFEDYDKETDENDSRTFWEDGTTEETPPPVASKPHKVTVNLPKPEITNHTSDWVDVEIDDDEDY